MAEETKVSAVRKPKGWLLFTANFIKHPGMIGSVVPSSRFLVERMLEPIDWDTARHIVEYGPGEGIFTREILKRMRHDAELVLIELNADLAAYLKRYVTDPRVTVIHGSAADINKFAAERGWDGVDYALSGIPFSTMPEGLRREILSETRSSLNPGGKFIVFQFSNKVFSYLKEVFEAVDKGMEFRNLPPAHCYRCSTATPAEA